MLGPARVRVLRNGLGRRVSKAAAQFAADAKSSAVMEYNTDSKELRRDPILLSTGVKLEAEIQSQYMQADAYGQNQS